MIKIDETYGVLKMIDIPIEQISETLLDVLEGMEIYKDQVPGMSEHMYSCEVIDNFDQDGTDPIPDATYKELQEIKALCDKYEASYFRFITM